MRNSVFGTKQTRNKVQIRKEGTIDVLNIKGHHET